MGCKQTIEISCERTIHRLIHSIKIKKGFNKIESFFIALRIPGKSL